MATAKETSICSQNQHLQFCIQPGVFTLSIDFKRNLFKYCLFLLVFPKIYNQTDFSGTQINIEHHVYGCCFEISTEVASELNKYVTSLQQFTMVTSDTDLGTLCFMVSPGEMWEIIIYCLSASPCTQIHSNIAPVNSVKGIDQSKVVYGCVFQCAVRGSFILDTD